MTASRWPRARPSTRWRPTRSPTRSSPRHRASCGRWRSRARRTTSATTWARSTEVRPTAMSAHALCTAVRRAQWRAMGPTMSNEHDERPWGTYQVLVEAPHYKVKQIVVRPGKRLSYQHHARRSEHWFVVHGEGTIVLD